MQSLQVHAAHSRPACIAGSALRGQVLSARPVQAQRSLTRRVASASSEEDNASSRAAAGVFKEKPAYEVGKKYVPGSSKPAPEKKAPPPESDDDGDNASVRAAAGVFKEKPAYEVGKKYKPGSK
ncbi:hypothetical protein WJX73_006144 [Symbiochloris irregularis]|uniref:Uncharacterized protein n=1 Tax=Symbiochloris irregularis TaxID=706552 RepID=A0AAW1NLH6_9CHLO